MSEQGLKLTIELVPQTSWYNNMRQVMPRRDWDSLRRQVYADYQYRCGVCGASKVQLNCHERWAYDDTRHIQTLLGFIALCAMCHHVKHIGLAGVLASQGKLDFEEVIRHFLRVNGCDRATFKAHYDEAFRVWDERSRWAWEVRLGAWERFRQR
jgi:hypothetical protein